MLISTRAHLEGDDVREVVEGDGQRHDLLRQAGQLALDQLRLTHTSATHKHDGLAQVNQQVEEEAQGAGLGSGHEHSRPADQQGEAVRWRLERLFAGRRQLDRQEQCSQTYKQQANGQRRWDSKHNRHWLAAIVVDVCNQLGPGLELASLGVDKVVVDHALARDLDVGPGQALEPLVKVAPAEGWQ